MGFIQDHPYIFWGLIIALVLVVLFIIITVSATTSTSTTPAPVPTPAPAPVVKLPSQLTDSELVDLWKSIGCSSKGTAVLNAGAKAFWRSLPNIDAVKKDMLGWRNAANKTQAGFVGCFGPNKPGCTFDARAPAYQFCAFKDSDKGDISTRGDLANNVSGLVSACNADSKCLGFNNNGVLKSVISDPSKFVTWTNDNQKGLFLKGVVENMYSPTGIPFNNPFEN